MLGLGYLGKDEYEKSEALLEKSYRMDINHQGIQIHIALLNNYGTQSKNIS